MSYFMYILFVNRCSGVLFNSHIYWRISNQSLVNRYDGHRHGDVPLMSIYILCLLDFIHVLLFTYSEINIEKIILSIFF